VLNSYEGDGSDVVERVRSLTDADFSLASVAIKDWNDSMSPWPADPVFGREPFGGQADRYLSDLTGTMIPGIAEEIGEPGKVIIAGYSMAGLFALYSLFRTDAFSAAVSASGSLWFPGMSEFVDSNVVSDNVDMVYLSLGDAEDRTRNRQMATVRGCTERARDRMESLGVRTVFELNPGNHFADPVGRTAKGIVYSL